jgi:ribosomal protein L36
LKIQWEHIGSIQKPLPPQKLKRKNLGLHECYHDMKTTKRDDKIRVLNLNPKHETKKAKQKHKD